MNVNFDMYIPPKELVDKTCTNCQNSKLQSYSDDRGNIIEVQPLCLIIHKLVTDTDAINCTAFNSAHFESHRIQNYKKLK